MFAVPGWNLPSTIVKEKDVRAKSNKKRKLKHDTADSDLAGTTAAARETKHAQHTEPRQKPRKDVNIPTEQPSKKHNTGQQSLDALSKDPEPKPKKRKRKRKLQTSNAEDANHSSQPTTNSPSSNPSSKPSLKPSSNPAPPPPQPPSKPNLTPLQEAMAKKLSSARFRHLNETLYTSPSSAAQALFDDDPSLFHDYHVGFRQQVTTWPANPVDGYVAELQSRSLSGASSDSSSASSTTPLPRTKGTCTIADLGCGDAMLAQRLSAFTSLHPRANLRVLSFDLALPVPDARVATLAKGSASASTAVAGAGSTGAPAKGSAKGSAKPNNATLVTKADLSALPLRASSINVAILCLALMGTNWPEFVDEAWRVLGWKGELWVAEIRSRFSGRARARGGGGVGVGPAGGGRGGGGRKGLNGRVVEHSIGHKRRITSASAATAAPHSPSDASELAGQADGSASVSGGGTQGDLDLDATESAGQGEQTDVHAFAAVLKAHGFSLDPNRVGRGGGAVDLGNKMFAKLYFVKDTAPVRGKNVGAAGSGSGSGSGSAGGAKSKNTAKPKFLAGQEHDVSMSMEEEAAVLKPCLYKIR